MDFPARKPQKTKTLEERAVEAYLPSLVPITLKGRTDDAATLDAVIAILHQQIAELEALKADGYDLVEAVWNDEGFARRPTGDHSERVQREQLAWSDSAPDRMQLQIEVRGTQGPA